MDDICDSVNTVTEAKQLAKDLHIILKTGGFKVKGWISNKSLEDHMQSERTAEMAVFRGNVAEKVLGMASNNQAHALTFNVDSDVIDHVIGGGQLPSEEKLTKRVLLSQAARIYDPLGHPAAFLIRAKIELQELMGSDISILRAPEKKVTLWQAGVDWDEEALPPVREKWKDLFREMKDLSRVEFPRSLTRADAEEPPMLCVFSDASQYAFGACIALTADRGLRITSINKDYSRIAWIQNPSHNFKPFVSARVGEIQSNSDPSEWKHIPGEENVADDISRGIYVGDLKGRWTNGPEFLQKPEELWPQEVAKPVSEEHLELRKNKTVCKVKKTDEAIDPKHFSSWKNRLE
ncbi:uncharacterized protein [Montipora capricornis]|uniref:uncharacterized protein n=1 Tax=Montipora capricornis TaxID=246305 RepID=UPI0035F1C848